MRQLIFITSLLIILQSCSIKSTNALIKSNFNYTYDTTTTIIKADLTAKYTSGTDLISTEFEDLVAFNYCGDTTIKILNRATNSLIVLKQPVPNQDCEELSTRIISGEFYLITSDNKIYQYLNQQEVPKLVLDLMREEKFAKSGLTAEWYKAGSDQHVRTPKNTIFFRVRQNYADTTGTYSKYDYNYPIFAKMDLTSKNVQFFGEQPYFAEYTEYGLISNVYDLYIGDSIIVSNAVTGEIVIINTAKNTVTKKIQKSKFDTIPIEKYSKPENKSETLEYKRKHYKTSPFYEPLYYNPHLHQYYRIFHPYLSNVDNKGQETTEFDKECVLMVFNDNLELIDEVLLPLKKILALKLYPTKEGLAITIPELFTTTQQESKFKYFNIKITKKK